MMTTPLLQEFPELSHLSQEDAEEALASAPYLDALVNSLPLVQKATRDQIDLSVANETLAKKNFELQADLNRLRSDTQQAFDHAQDLRRRWADVDREQKEIYQRFAPAFLLMRLRHSTTAIDDASERLASDFVRPPDIEHESDTARAVDAFVKDFREQRKAYHKRVIWGEKCAEGKVAWRDGR